MGDDGPRAGRARGAGRVEGRRCSAAASATWRFSPTTRAERFVVRANLEALVARLAAHADERPVVLASGDPCYFGIAPLLAARLGRDARRRRAPRWLRGAAFARLAPSWHDATVLSAHGRPLAPLVPRALAAPKVAFLTDETTRRPPSPRRSSPPAARLRRRTSSSTWAGRPSAIRRAAWPTCRARVRAAERAGAAPARRSQRRRAGASACPRATMRTATGRSPRRRYAR